VARAAAEADLTEQIRGIHTETKGAYGVPRITRELRDAFAVACRRHGIRRSMGRVGSSYDNAMAESFFASIKRELLHGERWRQNSEARMAVFSWLAWYNNRRRHSALGHLSPVEFERQAIKSSSLNLAA
jgi:transposase InsO family protein